MKLPRALRLFLCSLCLLSGSAAVAEESDLYASYAKSLTAFVNDAGLVDYKGLKKNQQDLKEFLAAVASFPRASFDALNEDGQVAFLTNAYNAYTLKLIIDNYPIKSSYLKSLVYPKNSIRQIDGAWDAVMHTVMGKQMTLNDIEHNTLRKNYKRPGIHMALVCAAKSCPYLRNEPYRGESLKAQFVDQTKRFLSVPSNYRFEQANGQLYLSSIFKWFGEDFVKVYGGGSNEAGVRKFIQAHRTIKNVTAFERATIVYTDYDWSLNEK